MIDLAIDTELDAQMKIVSRAASDCGKILRALNQGEVVSLLWAKANRVNNHTTRISDLRRGKHGGPPEEKILQCRAPGEIYFLYWKEI